ncbi:GATA transcription factor 5-like isoform X2 [Rhododendron vialii]|uniref:GATA transcription factor 5-like isoform X2 n=1 Tax=Rhododendron vialii TaxID=182163 RepID=UPI00265DC049|nr:GATA transcription factor 5-like isoform X2 [Rhododendron vialii]
MEYCIEAKALKPSFFSEYAVKSTQPATFFDEYMCANGISGVSCDDFSVDVFLDLSNEELLKEEFVEEESEEEEKDSLSDSSQDRAVEDDGFNCSTFSGSFDCGSISAGELSVPVDDLEHLEWLSLIVDDSASELSLLCPTGTFKENTKNRLEPVSRPPIQRTPILCFPSPVPAKARSKRSRSSGGAWSRASSSLSESSSTPTSSCGSSPTSVMSFSNPVRAADLILEPVVKKQKKRPAAEETGGETGGGSQTQRRCSHCQVQKTPQWRTGPLGAKTLCNACGVRYKSGRLFPEYRPACSPTFSGDVHSNSHRKVLEMRRQKDVPGTESGLTFGVTSF